MNRQLFRQYRYLANFYTRRNVYLEPPYLDKGGSEIPSYPPLNVQVKGYDFTVLEKFAKWVQSTAVHMDIEVGGRWATPCVKSEVVIYKKNSTIIENKYQLQMYERNVQIVDLPTTIGPLFLQIIKAALPEGVMLSVHEHMQEHYEMRKIPDLELRQFKAELEEIVGPVRKKK